MLCVGRYAGPLPNLKGRPDAGARCPGVLAGEHRARTQPQSLHTGSGNIWYGWGWDINTHAILFLKWQSPSAQGGGTSWGDCVFVGCPGWSSQTAAGGWPKQNSHLTLTFPNGW